MTNGLLGRLQSELVIDAGRGQDSAIRDLMGLVVLGGAAGLAYRLRNRVVSRSWTLVLVATIVVAAVVAIAAALAAGTR